MKELPSNFVIDSANEHVQKVESDYLVDLSWQLVDVCEARNNAPLDPIYSLIYQELQQNYQQETRRINGAYPFEDSASESR